jgi:hypothetical protein
VGTFHAISRHRSLIWDLLSYSLSIPGSGLGIRGSVSNRSAAFFELVARCYF